MPQEESWHRPCELLSREILALALFPFTFCLIVSYYYYLCCFPSLYFLILSEVLAIFRIKVLRSKNYNALCLY